MEIKKYGDQTSKRILIQVVGDHDAETIQNEMEEIRKMVSCDFGMIAVKAENWNRDLSPWKAPAVFGTEGFGDGAAQTLDVIRGLCEDSSKRYYLGGYSMSGLFSLWAAYETDSFSGIAAASPSVWFPRFDNYFRERRIQTPTVYLSLGDKEEKTKNAVMATVGDRIREAYSILSDAGVNCKLEMNPGGHFKDPMLRMAKAFAWVLENDVR